MKDTKKTYVEAMRIAAIFMVIYNHTEQFGFLKFIEEPRIILKMVYLFMSIFCKCACPLFFMISGALILDKNETYRTLLIHRVLRYIVIILLFSFIQYLSLIQFKFNDINILYFLKTVYSGTVIIPYWFLYSYLSILFMLPFFRNMVLNMKDRDFIYLFILHTVFVGIIPILEYIMGRGGTSINIQIPLVTSNIFFFLIGYWIEKKEFNFQMIRYIILFSGICFLISMVMTVYKMSIDVEISAATVQNFHNSLIAGPTIATYLIFKKSFLNIKNEKIAKILCYCGSLVMGIYLISELVHWKMFFVYNYLVQYIPGILACIIWCILTVCVSGFFVAICKVIINKIRFFILYVKSNLINIFWVP